MKTIYSRDVFGEPNRTSDVNNPYLFTGRRYDSETGLYYYRARYYDYYISRFLQTDPISRKKAEVLYHYAFNCPTFWRDPLGLSSVAIYDGSDPGQGGKGVLVDHAIAGTMIISPLSRIPPYINAEARSKLAEDPEFVITAYLKPNLSQNSFSNSATLSPQVYLSEPKTLIRARYSSCRHLLNATGYFTFFHRIPTVADHILKVKSKAKVEPSVS